MLSTRLREASAAVIAMVVLLALLATASVTYAATTATAGRDVPPSTSVSAGFARDMSEHHAQAVKMSFIIRERTNDKQVRTLAYDIINTQATQRGMMMGWLRQWGLPLANPGSSMEWMQGSSMSGMSHMSNDGRMPGMASPQELTKLRQAEGKRAETLFLQLMTRHHEAGVDMAQAAVKLSEQPEVRQLARTMVSGQQAEIKLMTEMLHERGAKPLPWPAQHG